MAGNFHESFDRPDLPLPSDRSTAFVFAGVGVVVAYLWRAHASVPYVALGVAALFAAAGLLAPKLIRPLNVAWMRLALLMSRIMNPIVMLLLFATVIVPAGLLMQLRRDPLRRVRRATDTSYWLERKPDAGQSMTNQF